MNEATYRYAYNQNKERIDIQTLTKDVARNNEYLCYSCDEKLIPKLGKIRIHHFSHEKGAGANCSKETYLHKVSKEIFYEVYNKCIANQKEFHIEYEIMNECNYYLKKYKKTCLYCEDRTENLIKYFSNIELQKKDENFIPDLLLYNDNKKEKIYIEIFVTHRVSDDKIESGNRIIEIRIKEESDIELIKQNFLTYKDNRIRFYNIPKKSKMKSDCKGHCKASFEVIYFNEDNEIDFNFFHLNEIGKNNIFNFYILNENDKRDDDLIKMFAAKCAKKKLPVRNCYLCRYHRIIPWRLGISKPYHIPIQCKIKKYRVESMEAENCDKYVLDYRALNGINTSKMDDYNF